MLLDPAFRAAARNFSTLFLVCAVVLVPLELGLNYVHRDFVELRELKPQIERLTFGRRIEGVSKKDLGRARRDRIIVTGIELALLPLLASATRRVLERDRDEELPTATDAWVHGLRRLRPGWGGSAWTAAAGLAFALAVGFLAYQVGRIGVEFLPDRVAFLSMGLVDALSRSVALPWGLTAWVFSGGLSRST